MPTTNEAQRCPKCNAPLATNGMKDRLNCHTHKCQFNWCYLTPDEWRGVRYVESPAPEWEDVEIVHNADGDLSVYRGGRRLMHNDAVSLRGFMGYVYADGGVLAVPCVMLPDGIVLPVAVRFKKGGA